MVGHLYRGPMTRDSSVPLALLLSVLATILVLGPGTAEAQSPDVPPRQGVPITQQGIPTANDAALSTAPGIRAKIESAVSAGPSSISANATVTAHDGTVLREGTNGWTCYPDMPDREGQNPMCLDPEWADWFNAYLNQEPPDVTQLGIGYMLRGGSPAGNTAPYAEEPLPDSEWMGTAGPHVMIIVPDPEVYEDLPTAPDDGAPWVMWSDTPYAHIIVPTTGKQE